MNSLRDGLAPSAATVTSLRQSAILIFSDLVALIAASFRGRDQEELNGILFSYFREYQNGSLILQDRRSA